MIRISAVSGRTPIQYFVYENENEFKISDNKEIDISKVHEAKVGDYVKSSNGYYLPVLRTIRFRKKTIRPVYFLKVEFPLAHCIATDYYADTDSIKYKYLNFIRDGKPRNKMPTARVKMLVFYISNGLDVYEAYAAAFNIRLPKTTEAYIDLENKLRQILDSQTFINLLKEFNVADTLKQALAKENIDANYLANYIKTILDDDKDVGGLKKIALQHLLKLYTIDTQENTLQATMNKIASGYIPDDVYDIIDNDEDHLLEQHSLKHRLLDKEIKS